MERQAEILLALALIFVIMAAALSAGIVGGNASGELAAAAGFFQAGALPLAIVGAAAAAQLAREDKLGMMHSGILAGLAVLFVVISGSLRASIADGDDKKQVAATAEFFGSSAVPVAIIAVGAMLGAAK